MTQVFISHLAMYNLGMKYCIDTNILFSFQKNINLGGNPFEVMEALRKAKSDHPEVRFLMPPEIRDEVYTMCEVGDHSRVAQLFTTVEVVSPSVSQIQIGARVLEDFLVENRKRNLDGLHIAEDLLVESARRAVDQPPPADRVAFQKSLQPVKETLRNRYRNATRTGFLDSTADFHLILLAREYDAQLVSADDGVLVWGRKMGVKEMSPESFGMAIRKMMEARNI